MALTEGQLRCVNTLDRPLVVTAGAGSGKTFTLTQRIVHALESGAVADIDEVCAITFTTKAAGELKARLKSALRSCGLTGQALKVDQAWVSTIHGMCARILRAHALELGIDPAFGVAGEAQVKSYLARATDEVLTRIQLEERSCRVDALFAEYPARSQGGYGASVEAMLGDLVAAASALAGGVDDIVAPGGAMDARLAVEQAIEVVEGLLAEAREQKPGARRDAWLAAVEPLVESARAALDSGIESAAQALAVIGGITLAKGFGSKAYRERVDEARGVLAACVMEVRLGIAAEHLDTLLSLAREALARYAELKRDAGVLDNNDLLVLAARALEEHPGIAARYAGRFKLVMVDEFQDTDQMQVDMIGRLAGEGAERLCTVGDAQQSIYRFRGADVSVYRRHLERIRESWEDSVIELSDNFRSHADVLAFADHVFAQPGMFGGEFMSLRAARDESRADALFKAGEPRIKVQHTAYPYRGGATELDARWTAARRIAQTFAEFRDAGHSAGEMVVLLGRMARSDIYAQAMREKGLACVITGGSVFASSDEAAAIRQLVRVLANPLESQELLNVLTGPLFALTAGDLLEAGGLSGFWEKAGDELESPLSGACGQLDAAGYGLDAQAACLETCSVPDACTSGSRPEATGFDLRAEASEASEAPETRDAPRETRLDSPIRHSEGEARRTFPARDAGDSSLALRMTTKTRLPRKKTDESHPVILRAQPEESPQLGALENARDDGLGRTNHHVPKEARLYSSPDHAEGEAVFSGSSAEDPSPALGMAAQARFPQASGEPAARSGSRSERLACALRVMGGLRADAGRVGVARLVERALVDSGWLTRLERQGAEGLARAGNAFKAVRMLEDIECAGPFGAVSVMRRFEEALDASKEAPGALSVTGGDFVRIMTVHASKGLEFPIVAVAEFAERGLATPKLVMGNVGGKTYASLDLDRSLGEAGDTVRDALQQVADQVLGLPDGEDELAAAVVSDEGALHRRLALMRYRDAGDEEEAKRLLYVALTRAREAIVISSVGRFAKNNPFGIPKGALSGIASALDPTGEAFSEGRSKVDFGGSAPASVECVKLVEAGGAVASGEAASAAGFFVPAPQARGSFERLALRPSREGVFSYSSIAEASLGGDLLDGLAARFAVSCDAGAGGDDVEAVRAARTAFGGDSSFSDVSARYDEDRATDLGTAFHRLAQLAVARRGAGGALEMPEPARIEALSRACSLDAAQRGRLAEALGRWFASDVAYEMGALRDLRAEVPFIVSVGGSAEGGERGYLEGEIDLLGVEGMLARVVDYKTGGSDDETRDELIVKHVLQACCYAYAVLLQGFKEVEAVFVRVERGRADDSTQPQRVRYRFAASDLPELSRALAVARPAR